MRTSIRNKFFFTLFATSSIVVAGMYFFMQWSFSRGFLNYVNTQDLNNMDRLADSLVTYYQQEGGWEKLVNNPPLWHEIQRRSMPTDIPPPPPYFDRAGNGLPLDRPPPPRYDRVGGGLPSTGPPGGDPLRIGPRMALVDADGQTVLMGGGHPSVRKLSLRPLEMDGRTIGYLGLLKPARLADSGELLYVEQQSRIFGIIAITMIVISMLLGIPLINHLLVPIKAMIKGAAKLTSGDYTARIPVSTTDELGRLSEDLNLLALTLEKNEQSRREGMADISHELRTPLAVLLGEIEAVQDGVREAGPTLAVLHNEVLRLNRLVGDLYELSLSDLGALSYRKQRLDPVVVLEQVVDVYRSRLGGRNIELLANLPPEETLALNADGHRLQQLFTNLLENSLRYTDPGGRVEVEMQSTGKELLVTLNDSAPAVSEEQRQKLFDRFYRVDTSRSRAKGGSGLGLAICRNIVEAHQGKIELADSPLGGMQIIISLPLA